MYLDNYVKLALGLEGNPDPTQAEIEAAVTATGYTGYVSMEYDLQKTPDPEPEPEGEALLAEPKPKGKDSLITKAAKALKKAK